ncbi:MAG: carbohydrate ABC transporter permease [Clostridia bacterium]|nr:carbohydrate ABC transporter permease [Clostridia bacterium]
MIQNNKSRIAGKVMANLIFVILSLSCLLPIILIISVSLSDNGEILKNGYSFLPQGFNLEAYKYLLKDSTKLVNAYKITLIATVGGTFVAMMSTITLAYVTSRRDYKFRSIISFMIAFTMLFNAGLVPTYIWVTKYLHLKNNLLVLILPGAVTAWNIILMRSFFLGLPEEIFEAAEIDGSSEWNSLFRIAIPLSKPALATVGLFIILSYFNSWQDSMLYMEPDRISVQYFLYKTMNNIQEAQSGNSFLDATQVFPQEPVRMAMAVVAMLPIVIVFPFLQKYFVKGITLGSVKG